MSDAAAVCPSAHRSCRAGVTDLPRRATGRPNPGASGKPAGEGRSILAFFIVSSAFLAVAADGPPDAPDPAANHTRVVVIRGGKGGDRRPIVALANPTCTKDPDQLGDTHQGIFDRELMRQALLIAARDELGLATRDEVLGEAIADDAKAGSDVELVTVLHTIRGRPSPAVIHAGGGANARTLFRRDLGDNDLPGRERRDPAEIAEELSRTEFPAVLKRLGLEGKPNASRPDGGLPAGVEDRLSGLGYPDVFAAVRDLHEAIRTGGESPARVGGLCAATHYWGSSPSTTGTPRTRSSRPVRSCMLGAWWRGTRTGPTDSGTAPLPRP